ncbi:putative BSD domain-containing protein [Lupinus albus]|uniref:Putative BSD domain-containing protein n=1 Tax=Lupinus albus TaxID=3870 RepID=A0A6A4Q5X6_LUPAL|nr:putative BSD domain-containing protein [Lupinus albus]
MSWLARSLANTLRLDEERYDENDIVSDSQTMSPRRNYIHLKHHNQLLSPEEEGEGRGVKEDLHEIKQTLTRQLWGMASFLASPSTSNQSESDFDHSLSSLPQGEPLYNVAVSDQEPEIEEEEEVAVVGITDEVLTFAMNIAMHPETWLDFPLEEEDDTDDFEISYAQQEHAAAIERLAPSLAALRIELCPCHMSESYFWKVYFVLLHSRLHKQDAEILFTPQVMVARARWMQELHKQMKPDVESFRISSTYSRDIAQHDDFGPNLSDGAYFGDMTHWTHEYEARTADNETEKHMDESSETRFTVKSVIEENLSGNKDLNCGRSSQVIIEDYDDDDEWPEEDSDLGGYCRTILPIVNEEDISFSDLEDDDYGIKPVNPNADSKVV